MSPNMMPSDCYIGWWETETATDSETGPSNVIHTVNCEISDRHRWKENGTVNLQKNTDCLKVKLCSKRYESSWTSEEALSEKAEYTQDIEIASSASPHCQEWLLDRCDPLGTSTDSSVQSWSSDMPFPSFEEAAFSSALMRQSLGTKPDGQDDLTLEAGSRHLSARTAEYENEHVDVMLDTKCMDRSSAVFQKGADQFSTSCCSGNASECPASHSANQKRGRVEHCPSLLCYSEPGGVDDNKNVLQNILETGMTNSLVTEKLNRNDNFHVGQVNCNCPRTNLKINANVDSMSADNDVSGPGKCSLADNNEQDEAWPGHGSEDLSGDSNSSGGDRISHSCGDDSSVLIEQVSFGPSFESDLFSSTSLNCAQGQALESTCPQKCEECRECVDGLPELGEVTVEEAFSGLSAGSCSVKDNISFPLSGASQLEQSQSDCCVQEQNHSSSQSSVISGSISYVPDEVLLRVFTFFSPQELCRHISAVCKRWHRLAYDSSLWRKLDVSSVRISGFQLCQIAVRTCGAIRYLDMSGLEHLSNAEMAVVAENCPDLTHLDVGFVDDLNSTMMHAVLTSCPKLEFINMEGCRSANNEMMQEVAASAGPFLKQLNFSHCSLVDESLWLMMQHIHGLTHLNIDGISWISELAVQHLASKYFDSLKSWELDGNEITDSTIHSVSTCHLLKTLCISFCEHLTDQSLRYLQRLENLEKLALRKGPSFSSAGLTEFLSSSTLKNLSYLDLTECQQLDDEGVQAIAQTCGVKLKTLFLSWCWDITDKGMEHVANTCLHMNKMYLVGLHRLEGLWLSEAVQTMSKLVYISFEQCNEVTDGVIEEAVRDKPDLVILNYYGEVFMHKYVP